MKHEEDEGAKRRPWFFGPLLALAVVAVSSAGAATKLMVHSAPISRAAWRLQATSLILIPGLLWDCLHISPTLRRKAFQSSSVGVLLLAAISLASHFGLWIWSLDYTSLPHSLLLVSMPPVILVVLAWIRCKPLSASETFGAALACAGVLIIAASARVEQETEVTLAGDAASFAAAIAFVIYLLAGKHLREWMPLFLYAFFIHAGAALLLSISCKALDGRSSSDFVSGPFGWLTKEFFWTNLYLAVGPGLAGHVGFILLLKYMDPIVISMGITLEPVIGSFIGWLLNVSAAPGLSTCIGGAILVLGTLVVNFSKRPTKAVGLEEEQIMEEEEGPLTVGVSAGYSTFESRDSASARN